MPAIDAEAADNLLTVRKIKHPIELDRILQRKWELIHNPTNLSAGSFRKRSSAMSVKRWLKASVPIETLKSTDVAKISAVVGTRMPSEIRQIVAADVTA